MKKDIVVIGAGVSGLGVGILLEKYFPESYLIVEKAEQVGNSFAHWTKQTQFISPSFLSEDFGIFDLNSVTNAITDSPGVFLGKERYTGKEYQKYLQKQYKDHRLNIQFQTEIIACEKQENVFILTTGKGEKIEAKAVIYAGGEYLFPYIPDIPGKDYALHNTNISCYEEISDSEIVIIGGYESGIDVAYNFVQQGKKVILLEKGKLSLKNTDPSISLSLHSQSRLKEIQKNPNFSIQEDFQVVEIQKNADYFSLFSKNAQEIQTTGKIIFTTGFDFSQSVFGSMFDFDENGVKITSSGESTKYKNLHLVGPMSRINGMVFCFIYKYKLLFPVVVYALAQKLLYNTELFESQVPMLDVESFCNEGCGCC